MRIYATLEKPLRCSIHPHLTFPSGTSVEISGYRDTYFGRFYTLFTKHGLPHLLIAPEGSFREKRDPFDTSQYLPCPGIPGRVCSNNEHTHNGDRCDSCEELACSICEEDEHMGDS